MDACLDRSNASEWDDDRGLSILEHEPRAEYTRWGVLLDGSEVALSIAATPFQNTGASPYKAAAGTRDRAIALVVKTVIEIFGKPVMDRILSRVTFHSTPLHASWVNIAEIELSTMTRPISPH